MSCDTNFNTHTSAAPTTVTTTAFSFIFVRHSTYSRRTKCIKPKPETTDYFSLSINPQIMLSINRLTDLLSKFSIVLMMSRKARSFGVKTDYIYLLSRGIRRSEMQRATKAT